ncbi:MAG: TerB N-terminal domain-containing protein [Clostridia bacterium]|nr:TerB N-terminal domain-containing protein [Clostridia bacterium]
MSEENKDRAKQLDDFWDIESLVPTSRKVRPVPPRPTQKSGHIVAVQVDLDLPQTKASADPIQDAPLPMSAPAHSPQAAPTAKKTDAPILCYRPKHPLIREVRVLPWRSDFHFYERFCLTARELFSRQGEVCECVSFFSYMPQYDQMNRAQLDWYLYWRDQVRSERYLPTDYSYIFLYLFEIINLPDKIPPAKGQRMLCNIWTHYRDEHPLLNRYLADWICDYSLIHQLPPPADELAVDLRLIATSSSFREFYAYPTGSDESHDAAVYLLFATNYDYKKSKFYLAGDEQARAARKHIPGAISTVLRSLEKEGVGLTDIKMQKATLSRDSFIGALCSGEMKRRIEVEYCSFQRSFELRYLITDIIKYTENRLRRCFGNKSQLSIFGLPDKVKAILDAYLEHELPMTKRTQTPPRPEYEALYDLPATEVSLERAAEIERASWDVTERLLEAFEESVTESNESPSEPPATVDPPPQSVPAPSASPTDGQQDSPLAPYKAFIVAVLQGDATAVRAIARDMGVMPDVLLEQVNDVAVELMGDILLESDENGRYTVIEDYEDDVKQILNL